MEYYSSIFGFDYNECLLSLLSLNQPILMEYVLLRKLFSLTKFALYVQMRCSLSCSITKSMKFQASKNLNS